MAKAAPRFDQLQDVTHLVGENPDAYAHEYYVAYQQAFELGRLFPNIENWRKAVNAYDAMLAASRKAG